MSALALEGVTRQFGGLRAVNDVTVTIEKGARHGLIGPNGAGKSTLFKLITGTLEPTSGTVRFGDRDVTRLAEHARAKLGMAQTFQHSSLFLTLTCRENVVLALQRVTGRSRRFVPTRAKDLQVEAGELLDLAGLGDRRKTPVAALSHGERRQLEVCVALACKPQMLLLDEPAAGMSPAETLRLVELLEGLPAEITMLIIEHDLEMVFRVAKEVTVLHLGALLASGPADEIRASEEVQQVYLGKEEGERLFYDEEAPAGPQPGDGDGAA